MPSPIFESVYPILELVRRNFEPSEVVDSLKVNSGERDFSDNIMTLNGFSVREGTWLSPNAQSKMALATSTSLPAFPVWQDPGAGRTDAQGGITVLQGVWTIRTNVINLVGLAVGDELSVGALPANHPVLPSMAAGLVRLATLAAGSQHLVVAHVEKIEPATALITNVTANYRAAGGV